MIPNNPISYAQLELRGGWRNVLMTAAIYGAAIAGLAIASSRMDPGSATSTLRGWLTAILVIQTANMLIFGTSRIATAVRADAGGAMIESHRLMPTSSVSAVLGYLVGSSAHALAVTVVNFIVGALIAASIGVTLDRWIIANGLLFFFGVCMWCVVAAGAFVTKGAMGVIVFLAVSMVVGNGATYLMVPTVAVLMRSVFSGAIFTLDGHVDTLHAVALAGQGAIAAVFFVACCRRYERSDHPAMGVGLSFILVGVVVVLAIIGMSYWEKLAPRGWRREVDISMQFVASAGLTLLLSLIPLANASRAWENRNVDRPRTTHPFAVALAVAAFMTMLVLPVSADVVGSLVLAVATGVTALLFLITTSYVLRWVYLAVPRGMVIGSIWTLLAVCGPVVADFFLSMLSDPSRDFQMGAISAISPLATLSLLSSDSNVLTAEQRQQAVAVGLIGQAILGLLAWALYHWSARRSRAVNASLALA